MILRTSRAPFLLPLLIALSACVPNQAYRTTIGPCKDPNPTCSVQLVQSTIDAKPVAIPVAFIEFDDFGQAFNPAQIAAAETVIKDEKSKHKRVVTILFIHGWKNNASDDSSNVPGFRYFLQQLQPDLRALGSDVAVVGVYFAWRGNITNLPGAQDLTYWNRRDTATYIPGSNMSEALLRVALALKGPNYNDPSATLIVVGHSFGGLVLERTVTPYLTRRIVENPEGFYPFADLLVFINEAAAATEGIQLLTMLKRHSAPDPNLPTQHPIIVSITSQGDLATGVALPIGQAASLIKKSVRDYGPPYASDPFGVASQKTYFLRSAAHIPQLESHSVGDNLKAAYDGPGGYTCVDISVDGRTPKPYYVVRMDNAANDTPYWIMQMPVQIVPDHSDIFRLEFAKLMYGFLMRQAANEKPPSSNCYSNPGALPDSQKPRIENMQHMFLASPGK
jgi:pimeloyl-ACP methyl ester carboxylesterase